MAANKKNIALTFGVYYGIFSVLLVVVQYATGDFTVSSGAGETNWFFTVLSLGAGVFFPVMALVQLKKSQGGFMSFGQGFKASFTVFIVSSLFVAAWMLIYTYVLEPNYQQVLIDNAYTQMQMQNGGSMSEQQMDTAMEWTKKMTGPLMLVLWTVLTSAILGAIGSLIYSGAIHAKPPVE
jgi:hypothetical protein